MEAHESESLLLPVPAPAEEVSDGSVTDLAFYRLPYAVRREPDALTEAERYLDDLALDRVEMRGHPTDAERAGIREETARTGLLADAILAGVEPPGDGEGVPAKELRARDDLRDALVETWVKYVRRSIRRERQSGVGSSFGDIDPALRGAMMDEVLLELATEKRQCLAPEKQAGQEAVIVPKLKPLKRQTASGVRWDSELDFGDQDVIQAFMAKAGGHRYLSHRGEIDLAQRYEKGDLRAKDLLMEHNLKLVVSVAAQWRSKMPLADRIQEGMLGLTRAAEKYDYRKGYRFSTYATWWIRQGISRASMDRAR